MTMNDPLSNALSLIENAEKVGRKVCKIKPVSKVIKVVLELIKDNHYIGDFKVVDDLKGSILELNLLGNINKCGVIKPRYPVKVNDYEMYETRFLPAKDFGIILVSTPKGIMTHIDAKKKNLGGKLIAYVY